ncbi:MAG TPA: DUF3179 domain-containing (seleno)protein, partial [Gemmataceae bacterium]|nr:DUF3179 domain-containing (seleno)protein [Gemmataceae bacterium]
RGPSVSEPVPAPSAPAKPPPPAQYPGTRQPPAVSAAGAALSDDDTVIGVVAAGRPRAYLLRAMNGGPENHVINDLVGGTPVSVTYCDLGRCVKVFTDSGSNPLELKVGGYQDGMVLYVGDRSFRQSTGKSTSPEDSGEIPLSRMKFEQTTWKKWREAHPDTDVVTTLRSTKRGAPADDAATQAPAKDTRP